MYWINSIWLHKLPVKSLNLSYSRRGLGRYFSRRLYMEMFTPTQIPIPITARARLPHTITWRHLNSLKPMHDGYEFMALIVLAVVYSQMIQLNKCWLWKSDGHHFGSSSKTKKLKSYDCVNLESSQARSGNLSQNDSSYSNFFSLVIFSQGTWLLPRFTQIRLDHFLQITKFQYSNHFFSLQSLKMYKYE